MRGSGGKASSRHFANLSYYNPLRPPVPHRERKRRSCDRENVHNLDRRACHNSGSAPDEQRRRPGNAELAPIERNNDEQCGDVVHLEHRRQHDDGDDCERERVPITAAAARRKNNREESGSQQGLHRSGLCPVR